MESKLQDKPWLLGENNPIEQNQRFNIEHVMYMDVKMRQTSRILEPKEGRKSAFKPKVSSCRITRYGKEKAESTIKTPNILATSHRFPDTRDQYFISSL